MALGLILPHSLLASRAVGGELTYTYIPSRNVYLVNLTIYYNCAARSALLNNYTVSYQSVSCGSQGNFTVTKESEKDISPSCKTQRNTCEGGTAFGFKKAVYKGIFAPVTMCRDWKISWIECTRNAEINTIISPNSQCLYLEALLNNYDANGNNSAQFSIDPISILCAGETSKLNYNIYDPDGHRLVMKFITPKTGPTTNVTYKPGFSPENALTSSPAITLTNNGDLTISPTVLGEQSVTAILIEEYTNLNILAGSVIRDLQFIVVDCNNTLPVLSGFNGTTDYTANIVQTCVDQDHCFYLEASDIDTKDKDIYITVNDKLSRMTTYDPNFDRNVTFKNTGNPNKIGICWKPFNSDIGVKKFSVTVSDSSCPIIGNQTYTYTINVNPGLSLSLPTRYQSIKCDEKVALVSTVTGGVPPYAYQWSSGENIGSLLKGPGKYVLTVTDFRGCRTKDSVILSSGIEPAFNFLDVCLGGTSRFYDTTYSTSPIISWSWDFGDGTFGSGENVSHSYSAIGLYPVKLTVTDALGCIISVANTVRVCNQPLLKIKLLTDSCVINGSDDRCSLSTIFALDSIYNGSNTCKISKGVHWDFGNGDTSFTKIIFSEQLTKYATAGVYTVTATIFINNCDPIIIQKKITIIDSPEASISAPSYYHKCDTPKEVYATLNSFGHQPITYEWFIGKSYSTGIKDSLINITTSGLYTIKITNSLGCSKLLCTTSMYPITVNFLPNDFCLKTSTIGMNNLSEHYWPLSVTSWDFGDGTTSSAFNPSHQYAYDSVFVPKLILKDITGCSDSLFKIVKTYLPYDTLQVISDPNYSCFSEKILLQGPKGKSLESFIWDFGTGEDPVSTTTGYAVGYLKVQEGNPALGTKIQYIMNGSDGYFLPLKSGYKKISLRVTYNNSCFKNYYDAVTVYKQLKVTGSIEGKHCAGHVITFNGSVLKAGEYPIKDWNLSLFQNPLKALDTINKGLPYSISGQSFTYKFIDQADGLLRIRVADNSPDHTCYADTTIDAYVSNVKAPEFTIVNSCINNQNPSVNIAITSSENRGDSTYFDFGEPGDTTVSLFAGFTVGLIKKQYKNPGTYQVKVKSFNYLYGCADSLTKYHTIYALPKADIGYINPCEDVPVSFENKSQPATDGQTIVKSIWTFEADSIINRSQNANYTFHNPGTFKVKLTVEDTSGCKDTLQKEVTIYPAPKANFNFPPDSLLFAYKDIQFTDQSIPGNNDTYISSWKWNFGDGDSANIQNPVHTYNSVDIFATKLTVTNQLGCIDDTILKVDLNPYLILPTAFSPNDDATNDELFLIYKGVTNISNFCIYNRWGELVFETKDLKAHWDGKFKNELQPSGIYQYYVTGQSIYGGEMKPLHGNLLLKH